MINYNIKQSADEDKKRKPPVNLVGAGSYTSGAQVQPQQTEVSGGDSQPLTVSRNADTWQRALKNPSSGGGNYAQRIKNMVTPSGGNEVQTRNYALRYGEGQGFNISDEDIQYKNGDVFVRGVNIGKPDRVDENGISYMSEGRLKSALDNIKSTQGGGVNGYDAQYDKAINQNLGARDTQAAQLKEMSGNAFDWYKTDPLATDYGKQVMSTYKALGDDDANNISASAGSGANLDSASVASMVAAQEARKLAGINAVTQYWAAAGEGQRGVMNDTQDAWNNFVVAGNDTATGIKDNQRADIDTQNQTNELDAKISGHVPLDVERRNNNFYYKDPVTGAYKLYYGGENIDYSALANEAEAKGDLETANRLREAAETKTLTNANYADMVNRLVPSQRAETNERYGTVVAQQEAQKDRDYQKEIMQLESDLNEKAQNNEINQGFLDNLFKFAYEDAKNNGNVERLNRLANWMNSHGYSVPNVM